MRSAGVEEVEDAGDEGKEGESEGGEGDGELTPEIPAAGGFDEEEGDEERRQDCRGKGMKPDGEGDGDSEEGREPERIAMAEPEQEPDGKRGSEGDEGVGSNVDRFIDGDGVDAEEDSCGESGSAAAIEEFAGCEVDKPCGGEHGEDREGAEDDFRVAEHSGPGPEEQVVDRER